MAENGFEIVAGEKEKKKRLDVFVAETAPGLSRSQVSHRIREGRILVNGRREKAGYRLREGDRVVLFPETPKACPLVPEDLPLTVYYEDGALLVVEKPAGMVVHPAAGHSGGTLVNALLHHCGDLPGIGGVQRPGIVHRLDKDTSGLLVVAKNDGAHRSLSDQFRNREVLKRYFALVHGNVREDEGVVDLPVGRHPTDRKKMSARSRRGKTAVTRWRVLERFGEVTFLEAVIETGRTHQIRVHLSAAGHPVVGDPVYGRAVRKERDIRERRVREALKSMKRQALHAGAMGFRHPVTGISMEFSSPLPGDMERCLEMLRGLRRPGGDGEGAE
ncbi:MAG TPA: RluA family pseudouridine synthase [Syntrophales bacterium]|nr:RluA family pseudouridine synthase [Syntrophales bacterium]HPX12196.1 RluA family pseudouridine synthase [Syntrophales bacterium]HQB31043.1 RluA family pseudouridine synthase [Syntrophales bacterium]HQN79152.1 RluA family pseudouridine synthase [Syntrophales bacterium]HQQ28339.1 RluA family pseudouridine synthase [Syntrophales bacterium]